MDEQKHIGVLYRIRPGIPLAQALKLAVANFNNAPHAGKRGHLPAAARFNPGDCPADVQIDGLAVLPDDTVRLGHVRICTHSFSPELVR